MIPDPPPGQGPIDPRGAFSPPPPPPSQGAPQQQRPSVPPQLPPPIYPPTGMFPGGMFPGPYPYPPPKQRSGFARGIFVTLATTLFGFSVLLNIYLLIAVGLTGDVSAHQTVLVKGDSGQ